ncbi:hypothetical protein ACIRL2_30400 [Embleya sp. NPDC127516]|uniref:hypothetical protein n=1 Tax=Embleya sp. NPDC127516 TaxID=3363990 RepID=UPI00380775A9
MTDALEYEAIKAVEATDPNKSVKELRGRSFLDYQLSKYSDRLPKPGTTSGYPDGPEKPGGDPAGKGTNNPKPVTNGPSGGAAELPRGETPEAGKPSTGQGNGTPETGRGGATEPSGRGGTTGSTTTRPGAGKPAAGEGKSAAGEPARGSGGTQTDPLRAPGGTTAGEPEAKPAPAAEPKAKPGTAAEPEAKPAGEPEAKPAPAAEPEAKPGTWDETRPTVPREAPVEPAAKPRTATAEKPAAPEYTPKTARSATEDAFTRNVNIAVKQNAAFEVAAFALEQVQGRLTSDYLNWMVRRAQQDPQFVDRYLTQYGNWQSMSWAERRRYEVDHFFDDGLDFINSVAFFPEMAKYMQAMQNFYRPASPGDPGMTSTEVTVEPYTGGGQTTDAANRITLGPDGQWHDRSRIYMLTDRDKKAAPPPARTPAEKQAPPQTQSRPPAKAPAKSGPQAKSGAQQSVDAKMREKSNRTPGKSGTSGNSVNPDRSNGSSSESHNNRLGEGGGHKPSGGGAPGPSGGGSSGPSNGGSGTSPGTGGSSNSSGYGDNGGGGSGNGGGGGQSSDPGPDSGNKGPGFGGKSSGGGGSDASKRV